MIHLILQIIAFQLVFLLVYDVFLKKETFFNWNRMYLLVTASLSIVLPFIKLNSLKTVVPQDYIISLPEVVLGQVNTNNTVVLDAIVIEQNTTSVWEIIFYAGLSIACCLFLYKVFKIVTLVLKNPKQSIGNIVLVELINSTAAFSFFNYIFLGGQIKTEDKETIIKHELIHAQQKHTLDLLFFEVLRILFWFNPLVYMYQNRIRTLHEFIADAHAVKHHNKEQYYQNLLAQVFETKNISFINTFFKQSLIKKRIVMLSKTKSKQIHLIKYALLIPMVFGMLVYTSAEAQEITNQNKISETIIVNQDLTDEQLKEKLRKELEKMKADGADFMDIYKAFFIKTDNYIKTKENYYRFNVYLEYIIDKSETIDKSKFINRKHRNYTEYLEFKKTDEAKETWENATSDGVLKLVVNDLKSLTEAEKKRYDNKKKLLFKDDFFTKFIMTDGKSTVTLASTNPIKEPKKDESFVIDIPFAVVEQVPIFPGCENLTTNEQKQCISNNISKHVTKNFNTKLAKKIGLKGRQRINVIFKINESGNITDVRARAPHPELETEAKRVIKTLPKMIPGKHKGENVSVPYSLPIVFQVHDDSKNKQTIPAANIEEDIEIPFAVIENVPTFPGCEEGDNAQKKQCFSDKVLSFVTKNFNTKLANNLGLTGKQRINVIFKINKEGYVTKVRSRAAHPALETEALRVISSLPKMKPGTQKGKVVTVPYSLPIIFQVEENKALNKTVNKDEVLNDTTLPYAVVDKAPILPECKSLATEKEKRKCTSTGIQKQVTRNFNTELARKLGLKGRQRINVVFKITKRGKIEIEKSRAPHPDLEAEAIRVIKSIPKLIPGKHKGKKVDVLYSLPIVFQVAD